MLTHPTLDKLQSLRLQGMRQALEEQMHMPDIEELSFEERFGLVVDREYTERETRRLRTRLSRAKLRHNASPEDIDYRTPRGLDKSLMTKLAAGSWLREHLNCLIIGPTGIGKSWLACALAHKACREGFSARHLRLPRLFRELAIAKGDGRYHKLLSEFAKTDLLLLDDLCMAPLTDEQQRDLLEILDDRFNVRSTLVTSQLPVEHWHQHLGNPTLADAILDRLVHNAYKINLKGESMRKRKSKLTSNTEQQ
jgi:DNA replication protein DnaC